jgi:hypothetical protein
LKNHIFLLAKRSLRPRVNGAGERLNAPLREQNTHSARTCAKAVLALAGWTRNSSATDEFRKDAGAIRKRFSSGPSPILSDNGEQQFQALR